MEVPYFKGEDVVLVVDCVAYAFPDFYHRFITGKTLAITPPKLDSNKESYVQKLMDMINFSHINTLIVVMMEVPCYCGF